jgi:hypothetical protein
MADNEQNVVPHVQIELAVLWADKTWSDGHFEYEPADFPRLTIKAHAIAKLEKKLEDNYLVSLVVIYAVDSTGNRFTAGGTLLSEAKA